MEIKNVIGDKYIGDYEYKAGVDLELGITKRSVNRAFVRANR